MSDKEVLERIRGIAEVECDGERWIDDQGHAALCQILDEIESKTMVEAFV